MPITTSNFAKALWPGINAWYGKAYDEHEVEWSKLFDTYQSSMKFEEDMGVTGLGLAAVLNEGDSVQYSNMSQGFLTRYTHIQYALGFIITDLMQEDDLYSVVGGQRAEALAFSMRQTKEIVAANVYNRAFNASYTGGDASAMLVNDHPNVTGGTWSNILSVSADISEAALEQATIDIMKLLDDKGLNISIMPKSLHIHVDSVYEVERILKSPLRSGTSNNDLNALNSMGKFPNGVYANHYFTDSTAWFIKTNASHGMKHFERKADSFAADNDFDTSNAKFKAKARYSFGWTDPRGIFGSAGA